MASYVRVHSGIDDKSTAYFRAFENKLREYNPQIVGSNFTLVDSEDIHKMTIVRSNDLLPSTDYGMWQSCLQAYIEQVTDPHKKIPAAELHIFPAEINACSYESEMPSLLGKDFRTLHPEVVALLEDRERFEMFVFGVALGFIYLDDSSGRPNWLYRLSEEDTPVNLTVAKETLYQQQEEDYFQVIHNFALEGRDQTPGMGQTRWIDWNKLRAAIIKKERDLGKAKVINHYKKEYDPQNKKGFVQRLLADVERRRSAIEDPVLRSKYAQEEEDLADLAKIVFMMRVKSIESRQ